MLPELQRYKDTVSSDKRGGPRTPSLTQTLIVRLFCRKRTYLHRSSSVKSQQNRIELVTRPAPQQPTTVAPSKGGLAKPQQQQASSSSNLMQILNGPPLKSGDKSKSGGQQSRFPTLGKVPVVPGSAAAAAAAAAGSAASPVTTAASVAYAQSRSGPLYRNSILFSFL